MGLDTSHGAWHGAYSAFNRWRQEIARLAGVPLELMEGFYSDDMNQMKLAEFAGENAKPVIEILKRNCPIAWDALNPDPLHILLNHSDCEGEIAPDDCAKIADRLEALLPLMPTGDGGGHIGNWRDKTAAFIAGCRAAHAAGEPLDFH